MYVFTELEVFISKGVKPLLINGIIKRLPLISRLLKNFLYGLRLKPLPFYTSFWQKMYPLDILLVLIGTPFTFVHDFP